VADYCFVNDLWERKFQMKLSGQCTKGKSCDTFCPTGPWLVTSDEIDDPQNLLMKLDLKGERMQTGKTSMMIFSVAEIIGHLSYLITLFPGELISSGTPPSVGYAQKSELRYLRERDVLDLWIEGLGQQMETISRDF
tara:strand:+ start:822 stop:1232 length:411 start_codon:yes stop_codon:yes gene_type:complete